MKKFEKYIFIDTNLFIDCIYQRVAKLDSKPLKDLSGKLKRINIKLILPEMIEREVKNTIEVEAERLKKIISESLENKLDKSKVKISKLINDSIKKSKKNCLKKITETRNDGKKIFKNITENENTIKINVTTDIIARGIKRDLFKIPPFNPEKRRQTQDCVAFESMLDFFEKNFTKKVKEFVFCTDDKDYYSDKNKTKLKPEIIKDLKKYFLEVRSYKNPLEMLKNEFSVSYSRKEIDYYSMPLSSSLGNISIDKYSIKTLPDNNQTVTPLFEKYNTPGIIGTEYSDNLKLNTHSIVRFCSLCGYNHPQYELCRNLFDRF